MKIIITMSLLMSLGLAAPTARADAKDDFCESYRLGIGAFDAVDRDVPNFLDLLRRTGSDLEIVKSIYRRFCTGHEYLARNRWDLLSKSDKCTSASAWHRIMITWFKHFSEDWQIPRTSKTQFMDDLEDAAGVMRRALVAMGCQ